METQEMTYHHIRNPSFFIQLPSGKSLQPLKLLQWKVVMKVKYFDMKYIGIMLYASSLKGEFKKINKN